MFGKYIVKLRKEKGITQAELANALGISRAALSLYEIEKREPDIDTLIKLALYFNVSVDYLLGNNSNKTFAKSKETFDNKNIQEQSNPEYTTQKEIQLLDLYRNYLNKGFSEQLKKDILNFFPELSNSEPKLTRSEEKILNTFKNLNEDNQDIIIGKTKELLREQRYEESIAEENLLKKAK